MIQINIDMPEKCGLCPLFHAEHPMYCQGVKADSKKKIVAPYGQPKPNWCLLHKVTADEDTISRKQAIEAHYEYCNKHPDAGFPVWSLKILEDLPSAQPDSKELSFTQKKLDTISRQAAIRWVKTECNPYGKPTLDFESGKKVIEHLKQMPSAEPDMSEYSDKLWKKAYERGRAEAQDEIVRCKDCKHWNRESICDGFCAEDCMRHDEDFYCGYAERKTDE